MLIRRVVAARQLVPRRPIRVLVGNAIQVAPQRPTIAAAKNLTARGKPRSRHSLKTQVT